MNKHFFNKIILIPTLFLLIFISCSEDEVVEDRRTKLEYKIDGALENFEFGEVESYYVSDNISVYYEKNVTPTVLFSLYFDRSISVGNYVNDYTQNSNNYNNADNVDIYFECEGANLVLKPYNLNIQVTNNDLSNRKIVGTLSGTMYDVNDYSTHTITEGKFTVYYQPE